VARGLARPVRLVDAKRHAEAERLADEVLEHEPDNVSALIVLATVYQGRSDWAGLGRLAERMIAARPTRSIGYRWASVAARLTGRFGDAYEAAQRAAELGPEDPDALCELATVLAQVGFPDNALRVVGEARRHVADTDRGRLAALFTTVGQIHRRAEPMRGFYDWACRAMANG
jgi:cytochrome c-type biogenesis protein CcmH/NrfG